MGYALSLTIFFLFLMGFDLLKTSFFPIYPVGTLPNPLGMQKK
jgi:hypothetical protein